MGKVTEEDYRIIESISNPEDVTKERVSEIEAQTKHDITEQRQWLRLLEMQVGVFT